MSRSLLKNTRIYVDGYDLSGYARTVGPLAWTFDEAIDDPMNVNVKGVMHGHGITNIGTVNSLFDNTATSGVHAVLGSAGVERVALVAMGMEAAPADNGIAFCGQFLQKDYIADPAASPVALTINFSPSGLADNILYCAPWGVLLHASAAETAANTDTGYDGGAQTTKGGYMCYQVLAGDGTATIKVQDADANLDGSFGDLLSSGVIDCSGPLAGIVPLSPTATVERYTRWQIALGTANTVTFALAFVRN